MYELLIVVREVQKVTIQYYGPGEAPPPASDLGTVLNAALTDGWEPAGYNSDGTRRERFVFRRVAETVKPEPVVAEPAVKKRGPGRPRKEKVVE